MNTSSPHIYVGEKKYIYNGKLNITLCHTTASALFIA